MSNTAKTNQGNLTRIRRAEENAAKIDILEDRLRKLEERVGFGNKLSEAFSGQQQYFVSKSIYLSRASESLAKGVRTAAIDIKNALRKTARTFQRGRLSVEKNIKVTLDDSRKILKEGVQKAKEDLSKSSKIAAKISMS